MSNENNTASAAAVPVELSDDEIYSCWLFRDCMDAIRAGDMRGQFISAARAVLAKAAPVAAAVPVAGGWISVDDRLPECDMKPGALGVEVLIYPQFERGEHTAFFGCRCTDYPSFYKHGVTLGAVTHWQPIPATPVTQQGE